MGGNPIPTFEPIISNSSPSLTPFEGSDFILEKIKAYLKDDLISPEIDHADFDPEGDIFLIERLLNNDPFQLPPIDLKQVEVTKAKSSIERQNDKTGLGMEKTVKDKAKSKPESQSSQKVNRKVNWSKSKSTPGPKSKKYKFRG
ncbi:hypothetical protein Tco_1189309 [Tanacetum coccineum]